MTKHGNKPFKLEYLENVVHTDIPKLNKTIRERIKTAIEARLIQDPIGLGKPLRYSFVGHRRIRVGDYRIVYRVNMKDQCVIIAFIRHSKDAYED
jgi:mRNA interferase RelE/StbE